MSEKLSVVPKYYPVNKDYISRLEGIVFVPESLKLFWVEHGTSFFNRDENDELVNEDALNVMLSPDEIIDILENADEDDLETYKRGLPFFERYDLCYFLITAAGQVINEYNGKVTVIADSIDDFVSKLTEDSSFYEALL
ncbi:hypothetical protein [Mesorhizobium sp. SP-1A]|uniref:hypothetical protein n=1 Tax=Mesorhizobium sp. SP-1A TaxID=3077840 RepID=UPI0028F736AA|nr:hypothetical protein [Mesorhizobium sp. SP-1A]